MSDYFWWILGAVWVVLFIAAVFIGAFMYRGEHDYDENE